MIRRMTAPTPLHIFKPGRHTAMSGATLEFSSSDLAASAAAYDPAKHEAPIVVGHPRLDAPAYGWISRLTAGTAGLEAEPHQVNPDFAEMVKSGAFKKISAAFFAPDAPQNPAPGVYYLRHVGFLGAQPPAVKGLRAPAFGDADEGVVVFAESELDDAVNAVLWRSLREWLIGKYGQDEADRVVPNDAIAVLDQSARDEAAESATESAGAPATAFATQGDPMSAEDKARLEALEAENKQLKEAAAASARTARTAAHTAFADGLVNDGRLAPGHQPFVVAFMDRVAELAGADEVVLEFAEGDGTKKCLPLDALKEFLQAQPRQVEFAELSADKTATTVHTVTFAAPAGYSVDASALEKLARAKAYAVAHQVSIEQALSLVK